MAARASSGQLTITGKVTAHAALIGPGGRIPDAMDRQIRQLHGQLGHAEVMSILPKLRNHVLVLSGGTMQMPGSPDQLLLAFESLGIDPHRDEIATAIDRAFGAWKGAPAGRTRKSTKRPQRSRR